MEEGPVPLPKLLYSFFLNFLASPTYCKLPLSIQLSATLLRFVILFSTYTLGTQSLTVLSLDAEAIKCPDGENFTDSTAS